MEMKFRKQHKGKSIKDISTKVLVNDDQYYLSIKRDGRMNQIAYDGDEVVKFWTSGGHEFYDPIMAEKIKRDNRIAFHVEAEFTGLSEGFLGDRGRSGVETKYRVAFAKGIPGPDIPDMNWFVFDILSFDNVDVTQDPFSARHGMLMQLTYRDGFNLVHHVAGNSISDAYSELNRALEVGYEGVMLTHASHTVGTKGRSTLRIKFKETPTAYGVVIGTVPGKGDRTGTIGALEVLVAESDQVITLGGLNRMEWELNPEQVKDAKVKFAYESRDGDSYIQARYLGCVSLDGDLVRMDKWVVS
jgi:hypothetical protein